MGVFSKLPYKFINDHYPCSTIHPWTSSCTHNFITMTLKSIYGTFRFFSLLFLVQLLLKARSLDSHVFMEQLVILCRTALFGGLCGGSSVFSMCIFRNLLGKFKPIFLGFIPGMIGGAFGFIEHPTRRTLNLTVFLALVMNLYIKIFQQEGVFTLSNTMQQLIFSVCSTSLLYYLRTDHTSYTHLWPFTPHRLPSDPEKRNHCQHKGDCVSEIKKSCSTYMFYGFALQSVKLAAKIFMSKSSFTEAVLKWDNLQLPVFSGLYVTLLKGVSCLLCQVRGQDEAWHTVPAGLIASLCYLIHPNFSLNMLAFSNVFQIVCRKYRKKVGLPPWPWEEMAVMVCMGLLFHARAIFPHCFPPYMFTLMDSCTRGRSKLIYDLADVHLIRRD